MLMRLSMIVSEGPSCAPRGVEAPGVVAATASRQPYVHRAQALLDVLQQAQMKPCGHAGVVGGLRA